MSENNDSNDETIPPTFAPHGGGSSALPAGARDSQQEQEEERKAAAQRLLQATGYDARLDPGKRSDYLTWDEYFMAVASLSTLRSKDPSGNAGGACIVNSQNRILAIGYDGFPSNCSDNVLPWSEEEDETSLLHTKHYYVCRAEVNAMLNKASADLADSRMYVTRFPCCESAKMMIQMQIRQVIYLDPHEEEDDDDDKAAAKLAETEEEDEEEEESITASRILLTLAGVEMTPYNRTSVGTRRSPIVLDFGPYRQVPTNDAVADSDEEKKTEEDQAERERAKWAELMKREAHGYNVADEKKKKKKKQAKRLDYLSWDEYFMALSFLSAMRSKDPQTQVGACIVSPQQRVVGIGYNGFPRSCSDDVLPWGRLSLQQRRRLHTKYPYVCHAEVNAICNKSCPDLDGCTLYVALFPCHECAKVIVQSRIRQVVYLHDKYHDSDSCRASRILFAMAGIQTRLYVPPRDQIVLRLKSSTIMTMTTTTTTPPPPPGTETMKQG